MKISSFYISKYNYKLELKKNFLKLSYFLDMAREPMRKFLILNKSRNILKNFQQNLIWNETLKAKPASKLKYFKPHYKYSMA